MFYAFFTSYMMDMDEGFLLLEEKDKERNWNQIIDASINNANIVTVWIMAICLAMGNAADAVEITCVGFIMTEMQMSGHISTSDKEFLSSAVFLGMLFGGMICGYLSDILGRKYCLLISLFLNAAAGFASALSPNIDVLIFCRVVGGIGIGGSVPAVFSLGAEIFPAANRGKFLSVIASFWMVGSIFTALFAWIMLGDDFSGQRIMPGGTWQWFAALCAVPALVTLLLTYYILPESPRFLVACGRFEEAAIGLTYLSGVKIEAHHLQPRNVPKVSSPPLSSEAVFNPFMEKQSSSPSFASPSPSPSPSSGPQKKKPQWLVQAEALFGDLPVRFNILMLSTIWFSLSFGSYGLSSWISTLYDDLGMANAFADSFIYSLATLPGNLLTITLIDVYGRRAMLAMGMTLAGLSVIGFALDSSQASVVILTSSLFNCFSVVGWNALDCLSCESFPTKVRTTAMGLLAAAGRVGAISAQFVNGSLEQNIPVLLFVTCGCTVAGGLVAMMLPVDPSGRSLSFNETEEGSSIGSDEEGEGVQSKSSAT